MSKMSNHAANKRDAVMNRVITLFVAGCAAELYLLIIRRYYVTGTLQQMMDCFNALPWLIGAGAALLVVGLILALPHRKEKPMGLWGILGWSLSAAGAFLAISAALIRFLGPGAVTLLCIVVPVAMLLAFLWLIYDRECAWSLTVLGSALIVLWVCRRLGESANLQGTIAKVCTVLYLLIIIAFAWIMRKADGNNGVYGHFQLFPEGADVLPVYVSCGLSFFAVLLGLFSTTIAYYAMWALALVVFALAVYYTVKQL